MRLLFLFFALATVSAFAQEEVPQPMQVTTEPDKNLVWNKWETENFIILSLDKSQGLYLKNNIENIKSSLLKDLGLEDVNFSSKCKLVAVPDREFMSKLFRIAGSHNEVRKNDSGDVSLCAIWLENDKIDEDLGFHIASICLNESVSNKNHRLFVQKGICFLCRPVEYIKKDLKDLGQFDLNYLINMTQEKWKSLSTEEKDLFQKQSELVCLFFRKEFGKNRFKKFLYSNQKEEDILSTYGFENDKQLNNTLNRYSSNLDKDIQADKTPDKYLKIK